MSFIIGTDEAGYGPNLGPLVVGASVWEVPDHVAAEGMYDHLARCINADPRQKAGQRVVVADSKQLHKGESLAPLERCVLPLLAQLGKKPESWRAIWPLIAELSADELASQPWHDEFDEPLPTGADSTEIAASAARLQSGLASCDSRLVDLRARALFPPSYNREVRRHDNKAEVLSLTTLELARGLIVALPPGPVTLVCDKHGGRDYYAGVLAHVFESFVRVHAETRELGVYHLQFAGHPLEVRFVMKGERHLPVALASVTAKYLRELAMRPFNGFWQRQVAGLKPTAGYYVDACRFREEIRAAQASLRIEDDLFWRER
ncbi:MAG: hypothetical protein SFU86_19430 [Pirellulaceae bacterium]|nr:hypothetical protein [Pirellulaceae bacterium]